MMKKIRSIGFVIPVKKIESGILLEYSAQNALLSRMKIRNQNAGINDLSFEV